MRSVIIFPLLFFAYSGLSAQDTSFTCKSSWKKGDHFVYEMKNTVNYYPNSTNNMDLTFSCKAHIIVLDKNANGCRVQWTFNFTEAFKKQDPDMVKALPVYNGLKIFYHTGRDGEFDSLENWVAVRNVFIDMVRKSIPYYQNEKTKKMILDKALETFSNRKAVESSLIKEIRIFHHPFGGNFSTNAKEEKGLLLNPFGDEYLPALHLQQADSLNNKNEGYQLMIADKLDSTGERSMRKSLTGNREIFNDSAGILIYEKLYGYNLQNKTIYKLQRSTGKLQYLSYSQTTGTGDRQKVETIVMRLR